MHEFHACGLISRTLFYSSTTTISHTWETNLDKLFFIKHIINDKNSIQFPFDTWNNFRMAQRLSEQLHTFFGKVWKSLRKIVGNMQKQLGHFQKLLSKQEENLMHQLIWLRKSWQVYTPISIKVASEKNDAWSMFHSLRCIIVASLVNCVPATSLET